MAVKIIFILVVATIAIVFLSRADFLSGVNLKPFFGAFFSTSTVSVYGGSNGSGGNENERTALPEELPAGFTRSRISPHFGKVRITAVRVPQTPSPADYEQISISASGNIDLGEWYLTSNRGIELIPYAVGSLDFALPQPARPVSLRNGDVLNVYSTVSQVGVSFRLNACAGYLNNNYPFSPPLPAECPPINRRDIITFAGICQDYILSLNACESASRSRPVLSGDFACQSYIQSLNYQGCVNRHRYDADFLKNEWWAWTGDRILDPLHDRVLLFDRNGLLVDEYVY